MIFFIGGGGGGGDYIFLALHVTAWNFASGTKNLKNNLIRF